MKDRFMFFYNFKQTADNLPDELRLKFYDALTAYAFVGEEPDEPIIRALVSAFKPSLDKEERRGGNHNPTGQNGQSEVKDGQNGQTFLETETETETEAEDTYTDFSDKSSKSGMCVTDDSTAVKKTQKFIPPTVGEVSAYCLERGSGVNPERFVDFYTSKGWMIGKSKMKDWRAAVRNWERETPRNTETNTFGDYL